MRKTTLSLTVTLLFLSIAHAHLRIMPFTAITHTTTDSFICDKTHKPYNYYKLWGVEYMNAGDKFQTADTSQLRIIANLPPATTLQWIHFDKQQVYLLKTGKAKKETYGNDAGNKNTVQYETKVVNFPKTLLKRGITETFPKGSVVLQTAATLTYDTIATTIIKDNNLNDNFSAAIKSLIPSALKNYPYKDKYNQDNFKDMLARPIGTIQQLAIPGLACYVIRLDDFSGVVFISINGKLSLLTANLYNSAGITAYKLNNNYFVCLNGYFTEVFEIRNSGTIQEWKSN